MALIKDNEFGCYEYRAEEEVASDLEALAAHFISCLPPEEREEARQAFIEQNIFVRAPKKSQS